MRREHRGGPFAPAAVDAPVSSAGAAPTANVERAPAERVARPEPLPAREPASAWPGAIVTVTLALAWLLACYWATTAGIVNIWSNSDTYAHGFLVVPIVAWLVARRRRELAALEPRPSYVMLVPFALAGTAWLVGGLAEVNAVTQFALAVMIVCTVAAVLGIAVARTIAFPLGFLFFAVPFGDFLLPQLMEWTATFTVAALRASGVPVYREGLEFVIPSGTWSVVEACSGVRYLIASLMVGTLYAYLTYRSPMRRWGFVGVALAVPIVANWLRAYMIVMLGHLSGNKIAVGVDHLIYGWIFFGVVMALMFAIGGRWREDAPDEAAPAAAAAAPIVGRDRSSVRVARCALAVVVVGALALLFALLDHTYTRMNAAAPPTLDAPAMRGGWQAAGSAPLPWRPVYDTAPARFERVYVKDGATVGLFVGYYRNQDASRKLVSSVNGLVRSLDPVWAQVAQAERSVRVGDEALTLTAADVRARGNGRLEVWRWYWVDGQFTNNDYRAKLLTALAQLRGRGDDSAAIVVFAPKDAEHDGDAVLADFAAANLPAIRAMLQDARARR